MSRRGLIRGTKEVSSDVDASDDGNDDGERTSEEAFRKLADGAFASPTLSGALEMLGVDGDEPSGQRRSSASTGCGGKGTTR